MCLDSERFVAQLQETEEINFVLHRDFLGLLVMVFGVGQGFERFSALFLCNETCALEIVQGKNVLKLGVTVNDGSVAVHFSLFQNVTHEFLEVIGLFVSQDGRQIFKKLTNFVLS